MAQIGGGRSHNDKPPLHEKEYCVSAAKRRQDIARC